MKKIIQITLVVLLPLTSMAVLSVNNSAGASGITSTSAWLNVAVAGTNSANPSLSIYWGTADGGTNVGGWQNTNSLGIKAVGSYTSQVTGLTPMKIYFYRARGDDGIQTNWATYSAQFFTSSGGTSAPTPSVQTVTVTPSTHILAFPSDFFMANGFMATGDVSTIVANLKAVSNAYPIVPGGANVSVTLTATGQVLTVAGTLTNVLSSDGSVSVSNPGGPQPNLSITSTLATVTSSRYFAMSNATATVEVYAMGNGITASRTNSVFHFSIPAGRHLSSWQIRADGSLTDGGKLYLMFGTSDVNNSSVVTDWTPIVGCFREDSLANVPVVAFPLLSDPTQITISGLGTTPGVVYHIRGSM